MKRGSSASSSSASRSFLMAVLMLCSKFDKGVGGPQPLPEFLPRHQFARLIEQDGKDVERHFLELDLATVLAQFTGDQVDFEGTETDVSSLCGGYLHGQ